MPADNDTDLDIDPCRSSKLRTTEQMIALLKSKEGHGATAYWNYSQYSIGYGSACTKDEYPNGITEAQADILAVRDAACRNVMARTANAGSEVT